MRTGRLPGSSKDATLLVMGTVRVEPGLWETYLERGGTSFDTAHHYGAESELAVGALLERLGDRDRVTLVGKGCHPPTCAPEVVSPQLDESLERLRTDHVDLYLLHRDNPDVPVGEFADALQREVAAGRMRTIGVSNWTIERFDAFNEHARRNGLTELSVLSNQLSLARMEEPVWDGCLSAFGDRPWLERTQTALLAWSSQARGFFAGRPDDPEVRHSWSSVENLARRRRATALAAQHGVATQAVALAWVLAQPFPSFAVVGPRTPDELDGCLAADGIELDPAARDRLERGAR